MSTCPKTLLVCQSCRRDESRSVVKKLIGRIEKKKLQSVCKVEPVGCLGFCKQGPVVKLVEEGVIYGNVQPQDCKKILKRHLAGRKPIRRLLLKAKSKNR